MTPLLIAGLVVGVLSIVFLVTVTILSRRNVSKMKVQVADANAACADALKSFKIEVRKKEEFSDKIGDLIRERDIWREWYNREAAGHGNAQSLMMGTIETLKVQLERHTGRPVKVDPLIAATAANWGLFNDADARAQKNKAADEGKIQERADADNKAEKELRQKGEG